MEIVVWKSCIHFLYCVQRHWSRGIVKEWMKSWKSWDFVKCGLFQCECQFAGLLTGEIQKEAYLVAISPLEILLCARVVMTEPGMAVLLLLLPKLLCSFKYIAVWACQAELKTVGLLFVCTASFCKLEVHTLVLLNAPPTSKVGKWKLSLHCFTVIFEKRWVPASHHTPK